MSWLRWPLHLPGRWLVPLFLLVFALLALALRYHQQMQTLDWEVHTQEQRRLLERLSVEQTRLDVQTGQGNPLLVRRLVGGLALHEGLNRAYLVGADGQVQASLSRLDLGQPLASVLSRAGESPAVAQALGSTRPLPAIQLDRIAGSPLLTALVPVLEERRLLVVVDLSVPLAQRRASVQAEVAREGLLLLAAVGLLAALLHLLWFRRAQHLAQSLADMGSGNLAARSRLSGGDELALIGAAADRMAGQLQAGQERIRRMTDIINRSPLVVIEWRNEPGWPVSYVSESVAQWGYTPADFLEGQLVFDAVFEPDELRRVDAEIAHHFAHGPDEFHQEYRIRRADGRLVWVDDHTSLARRDDGSVRSISGILLDITAQKEAQQAQREQAELLRMFYELPFLGMAISSPTDKRWLQVNDRLCEILGYPREELLRMNWAEMTPPGDRERNVKLFDELLAGQRNGYRMAKRFVRKDGRFVHTEIDVRAVRDEAGQVKQLFATIQDVTERLAAEMALQQSQELLLKAQEIGRMGSWSQDLRSGVITWSPQAYAINEVDPLSAPLTMERILAMLHPDDREILSSVYGTGVAGGQPYDVRYRLRFSDGRIKYLHVKGEFEVEDGRPVRSVGMVVDETELVEAQRERDRLATVMETTTDIVSMADPQGRTFYFNRAGYEVLGLPPGPPDPGTIARVHPGWASQLVMEEGFPAVMRTGRWLGETAIINAQGIEVPMSQLIMAHHGANGQIDYVWTILRDISERKASEEALRQQQLQLAEAQSVARIGSWSIDMPEVKVSWSDEHYRVLGFAPGEVEPSLKAYLSRVHPDDLPRVREHVMRDLERESDGVNRFEHRLLTPDGVRWVEERARLEKDAAGRVVRVFGTSMDITERVLAAQVLTDLKDMLEQAETVSLLGSWAGDAQTQRLNVSAQLFRNLGLEPDTRPPSEALYLDRIHPDDRPQVTGDMQRIREGGEPEDLVFRTNPAHGPVRWMRRTARRIDRSAEGLQPRYIGTLLDITEAVLAEENLRQINQELERRVAERTAQLSQANQELEAFSYTVSHDLKAPLRGIDGYSQLLVEDHGDRLDDEGRQFVRRIRQGVQQMGELISDLLEYSRMERRDMAAEPVALLPLVHQILDSYEADIRRQGAQLQLDLEPFTLPLDREGIAVVLRNLIGNALKFSRDRTPPRVVIGTRSEAGRRILWVRDNGVGFDMKYHDRMFGIFQRLHRAEEFPGTGVGLALVAKAVQRMGGRIWAESTLGAGATFYLEFPE